MSNQAVKLLERLSKLRKQEKHFHVRWARYGDQPAGMRAHRRYLQISEKADDIEDQLHHLLSQER